MATQGIVDTGERLSKNKVYFSLKENDNNDMDFTEKIVTCSKIEYYKTVVQFTLQPDVRSLFFVFLFSAIKTGSQGRICSSFWNLLNFLQKLGKTQYCDLAITSCRCACRSVGSSQSISLFKTLDLDNVLFDKRLCEA